MATLSDGSLASAGRDEGFFQGAAIVMALVLVAGFSVQLAMGRSSFSAPPLVHAHAVVFMGWVAIYLLQNTFVATGRVAVHRRLGWIATIWVPMMLALGCAVTIALVRRGEVPVFFRPLHFLVFDPVTLLAFAGLTTAAILMRSQTDWHRRLHFCAMALLLGPGFGRLLPMPLLIPWAFEATFAACLIFPLAGMWADKRRAGRVHPAWRWGVGATVGALLLTELITYSPAGAAIYNAISAGSPGAAVAPLAFPALPGGAPLAGRGAAG